MRGKVDVKDLLGMTGQESGIVIYEDGVGIVYNWSSIEGLPLIAPWGIVPLSAEEIYVEGQYEVTTEEIFAHLEDVEVIADFEIDLVEHIEDGGTVYILGRPSDDVYVTLIAPKGWI